VLIYGRPDATLRIAPTRAFFREIALGAGADCAHRVLFFFVHGQDQDGQLGRLAAHLADQVDAAAPGHREVEQEQVEAALAHQRQHLEAIRRFAHDLDVERAVEDALETLAHDRMIICNDYSYHRCISPRHGAP
jgi:hypothetical protein